MSISLDQKQVRALAKKLGIRVNQAAGRKIKHTDVIADIASVVGERPDVMMHKLKVEAREQDVALSTSEVDALYFVHAIKDGASGPAELEVVTEALVRALGARKASEKLVEQFGFEWWETGGGFEAYKKTLRSEQIGDDEAFIEVTIAMGAEGVDAAPMDAVWATSIDFNDDRGGDNLFYVGDNDYGEGTMSLIDVLRHIESEWVPKVDGIWDTHFDREEMEARLGVSRSTAAPR